MAGEEGMLKHCMPKVVTQQTISDKWFSRWCQSNPPFCCDTDRLSPPTALAAFTCLLIGHLPNGYELKCLCCLGWDRQRKQRAAGHAGDPSGEFLSTLQDYLDRLSSQLPWMAACRVFWPYGLFLFFALSLGFFLFFEENSKRWNVSQIWEYYFRLSPRPGSALRR